MVFFSLYPSILFYYIILDDHFPYWIFISIAIVHGNLMCWVVSGIGYQWRNLFRMQVLLTIVVADRGEVEEGGIF